MSTPTLKELCAKATPGPYHFYAKQRPRRSNFEGKFGAVYTGSVGAGSGMDATKVCELKGANEVLANAQLIARLSPEVMVRVYDIALEIAQDGFADLGVRRSMMLIASLLDGLGGAT